MRRVPEKYRIVSKRELARRLGVEPDTLGTYLYRKSWHLVPEPDGRLERSPYWYEGTVRQWEDSLQSLAVHGEKSEKRERGR